MNLTKTIQIDIDELKKIHFDIIITSSGYESRAKFLIHNFKFNALKKICFGFTEYAESLERKSNDLVFKSQNFEIHAVSGNDNVAITEIISNAIEQVTKSEINLLIDYSCMTRVWYAAIVKHLRFLKSAEKKVNLFFVYSFSKFVKPPQQPAFNKYVGPIEGFYSITIPNKPSAVIIGLGYLETRAYGLAEFFDVEPHLFVADSSVSKDFFNEVSENNKDLIKSINEDHIFYYPLSNLKHTETMLFHLTKDLLDNYRIVLAPCGPKPFTLICLITSLRFDNVDVWRISAGEDELPIDKPASGSLSIFQVSFN